MLPQAPLAVADSVSALRETPTVINVLANDSDPNNFPFSLQSVTTPGQGSAVLNKDGTITYTPAVNFLGADSFQYTISNSAGLTATASVNVTVNFTPQARHWTGHGSYIFWTDAGNWDHAPMPGDRLVFDGTQSPAEQTLNDFPAGTAFAGITLQNVTPQKWILGGNRITLAGPDAIVNTTQPANGSYWDNELALPIVLTADASFHGLGTSTVSVDNIDTNGHTLTLGTMANAGFLDSIGLVNLSGTGALVSVASTNLQVVVEGGGTIDLAGPTAVNCQWLVYGTVRRSEVDVSSTGHVQGRGNINSPLLMADGAVITAGNIGKLNIGSLTLNFGSQFDMTALGTGDGQLNQLIVAGTVNLNNAQLNSFVEAQTPAVSTRSSTTRGTKRFPATSSGCPKEPLSTPVTGTQ